MTRDTRWYSDRLGRDMGIVVYGHWGPPMILFPTSGGDEAEIRTAGPDRRDRRRHRRRPREDVLRRRQPRRLVRQPRRPPAPPQLDAAAVRRVHPAGGDPVHPPSLPVGRQRRCATMGASLGAYHAANTLFKYPDVVKRCFALSGVYDMKRSWTATTTTTSTSTTRSTTSANVSDPWLLGHWRPATSTSRPDRSVGAERRIVPAVADPRQPRNPPLTWTTGVRSAGTTGRTGSIRCGSTSNTSEDY